MIRSMLAGMCTVVVAGAAQAGAADFFPEKFKDFGVTPRGRVLTHYFALKNTSGQTVTLGQPRVSCGCVTASIAGKWQLAPGESTAVLAQMDTNRIPVAGVTRTVTVYVPFPSLYEEAQLRVQAVARDDLVLGPDSLAFGTVRSGQAGKATARVTFYGDPNWRVTQAASTGAYIKAEAKEVARRGAEVTYDVAAELLPDCPAGNWTADVWLATTTPGVERLRIPATVTVVAPIAVNPDAVRFGEVKVGEPAEQKVILQGAQPFTVTEVKGADGDVKVEPAGDGARPVHVLKVTLTASQPGAVARSLEILTDSKEQPKVVVSLTARATAATTTAAK